MREIKFRAWSDTAKKFVTSRYNHNLFISIDNGKLITVEHDDVCSEGAVYGNPIDVCLEQYTGLKLGEDVELYDGDIIKFDWLYQQGDKPYTEDSTGIVGVIKWRSGRFIVSFFHGGLTFDLSDINQATFERFWSENYNSGRPQFYKMVNFELLGNIHENPELVELAHD